jgi:ABC-2 type transport system permease protein
MPISLQVIARLLPLTYTVEALRAALNGGSLQSAWLDLAALTGFTVVLFAPAVYILGRRAE